MRGYFYRGRGEKERQDSGGVAPTASSDDEVVVSCPRNGIRYAKRMIHCIAGEHTTVVNAMDNKRDNKRAHKRGSIKLKGP